MVISFVGNVRDRIDPFQSREAPISRTDRVMNTQFIPRSAENG
jgi:hypothetical protein